MSEPAANLAVLITGASSGIGAGLAREFARRGWRVALAARRAEQLEALAAEIRAAGGQATAHRADVTVDGDLTRVVAELGATGLKPGIVIANAGFGVVGNAQKLTLDDYRRQFATNIEGVVRTFQETIGALRETGGRFVIMGSVTGYVSIAGGSPYAMSKFALRAFAEALHGDLKGTGVGVTYIAPGYVASDIRRTDNRGGVHPDHEDPIPAWLVAPAETAARAMARGILRGRREVVITFHAKVIIFFARHFPRLMRFVLVRNVRARAEPKR